jgi:peptidoglycan/LPS O-acetylase OafA/YrhL
MRVGGRDATPGRRFPGLDSIRFLLASWVVLSHVGYDVPLELPRHGAWIALRAFRSTLFDGPAAVIAFFVISGFCIHYPNRRTERVRLLPFYVRRELRILPPVVVVLAIGPFVGCRFDTLNDATLWSLVCEEIYYFLYPLLLAGFRRVGVGRMIAGSFVVAYAVVWALAKPHDGYRDLGWRYTWIVGLPCWLLGCELAEQLDTRPREALSTTSRSIWMLRGAVFVASMLLQGLHFHSPLTFPWAGSVRHPLLLLAARGGRRLHVRKPASVVRGRGRGELLDLSRPPRRPHGVADVPRPGLRAAPHRVRVCRVLRVLLGCREAVSPARPLGVRAHDA